MTKEKLIEKCFHICDNKKISSDAEYLASTMRKFFESNVCIPKGENRHPYADVMHEWVEGVPCEIKMKFYWDDLTTFKELYDGDILRIKPSEPVYEWQWIDVEHRMDDNENTSSFIHIMNNGKFMTYKEANALTCYGNVVNWEETKRVRQ